MRYSIKNKPRYFQLPALKTVLLLMLLLLPFFAAAQEEDLQVSKAEALRLFDLGEYSSACRHFDALGIKFPRDPEYMYYRGACLIELGGDTDKALEMLEEAIGLSSSVKSVPAGSYYYLGRALQLKGRFDEAISNYDAFRDRVRKSIAKDFKIDELIAMCTQGDSGKVVGIDPASPGKAEAVVAITDSVTTIKPDTPLIAIKEGEPLIEEKVSEGQIENTAADYDSIAAQALEFQFKADSLSRLAARYRSTLKNLGENDRESIRRKILDLEENIFRYQSLADRRLNEAAEYNRLKFGGTLQVTAGTRDSAEYKRNTDRERLPEKTGEKKPNDTVNVVESVAADTLPPPKPVLALFSDNKEQEGSIPVNDTLPGGLYYRIQTAAFRNPVKPSYFKKLGPVYGVMSSDSDITFYFIGMFRRQADARSALVKVRSAGFKDAFVVAIMDGERVSFERAETLESKWAGTSLVKQGAVKSKESMPLTLVFRVEAARSEKKFTEERLETMRHVAGKRDFDIVENEEGDYVCLIGKFLTFESAQNYSDLLYRNGLKEANVVAYMGEKEIPVEKAKELFKINFDK